MYLLDTNIVSYWMRGHGLLLERIKSRSPKDLSISAITLAEIYYGIEKSPVRKKERRTKILESTEFLTCFYPKNRMSLEGCHHISQSRHRFAFQTAASDLHQALGVLYSIWSQPMRWLRMAWLSRPELL